MMYEVIGNKIVTVGTDQERETIATTNEPAFGKTPYADLIVQLLNKHSKSVSKRIHSK